MLKIVGKLKICDMKNLKLNTLANQNLDSKEMNAIKGGSCCGCSCQYAGNGGSSTSSNNSANKANCWGSTNQEFWWILQEDGTWVGTWVTID